MKKQPVFWISIPSDICVSSAIASEIVNKHIRPLVMAIATEVGNYEITGKVFLGAVNAVIARNTKLKGKCKCQ